MLIIIDDHIQKDIVSWLCGYLCEAVTLHHSLLNQFSPRPVLDLLQGSHGKQLWCGVQHLIITQSVSPCPSTADSVPKPQAHTQIGGKRYHNVSVSYESLASWAINESSSRSNSSGTTCTHRNRCETSLHYENSLEMTMNGLHDESYHSSFSSCRRSVNYDRWYYACANIYSCVR